MTPKEIANIHIAKIKERGSEVKQSVQNVINAR